MAKSQGKIVCKSCLSGNVYQFGYGIGWKSYSCRDCQGVFSVFDQDIMVNGSIDDDLISI